MTDDWWWWWWTIKRKRELSLTDRILTISSLQCAFRLVTATEVAGHDDDVRLSYVWNEWKRGRDQSMLHSTSPSFPFSLSLFVVRERERKERLGQGTWRYDADMLVVLPSIELLIVECHKKSSSSSSSSIIIIIIIMALLHVACMM